MNLLTRIRSSMCSVSSIEPDGMVECLHDEGTDDEEHQDDGDEGGLHELGRGVRPLFRQRPHARQGHAEHQQQARG